MAKLVFGMNQSLDGYVDHMAFAPGPALFRHFIEQARNSRALEPDSKSCFGLIVPRDPSDQQEA
jgi:hypothetical protein